MNGPIGVLIGAAKGVIRSMLCNGELKSEIIPVDIAVNGLVVMPYHISLQEKKPEFVPVYNETIPEERKRTWKWVMDIGRQLGMENPFEMGLWFPDGDMTENKLYHWFCVIMFMWLPAYFIDFLLFIFRQRRFMVRVQTKISVGLEVLQFFTTRSWDFKSNRFEQMYHDMTPEDRIIFKINTEGFDDVDYMRASLLGGRQYVMKEPLSTLPRARAQYKCMYYVDRFCKFVILSGLTYWIGKKIGLVAFLHSHFS